MRGSRSGLRHLRWLLDRVGPSPRLCLTRLISTPSSDKSEGAQCLMVNKDGHEINEQVCHIGTPKGVIMCECVCAPAVRPARGRSQKLAPGSMTCCDGYQVPCRTCGAETGGYARLGRSSCGTCAGRVAPGALSEGAVPPLPLELRGLCEGVRHLSAQEGRFPPYRSRCGKSMLS